MGVDEPHRSSEKKEVEILRNDALLKRRSRTRFGVKDAAQDMGDNHDETYLIHRKEKIPIPRVTYRNAHARQIIG